MKVIYFSIILTFLAVSCRQPQASIREEVIELTTYPFSDPDPVPRPENVDYPYFHFDGYTREGKPQSWETVALENKYIRVTIIPAIGGKIWGAVEKSAGEEFIYFNHTVKFRDVAMRGPWTSGGIEANFGIIGHAPTTSTPVDYYTRTNDDGSVSCFIGSLELITRTWWQIEVNLPKDRAYFTTRMIWHNASPLIKPYYQWMNAGYKASDDLEMYFPGQYYIGHDGDVHAWSVDAAGRDLSKYAQNNFGSYKSYHVMGNLNDFYAAYYTDSRFGSVHYAPYGEKLGMKVWIWGLSRQGMIWEDLLTDTDGQYVELQSGRLYNQAALESNHTPFKQFSFQPNATDRWMEYWFPVKKTGGVAKANAYGSLNVVKSRDSVTISFCPIRKINDDMTVTAGGKEIFRKRLSLDVLQTWTETLPLEGSSLHTLHVNLGDRLLEYSEDQGDNLLARPVEAPRDFDRESSYGLYLQGQQAMYMNRLAVAEKLLKQSLALEPYFTPALNDLAAICYQRGRYAEADSCARIVLSINTYDPDGNLLYALANSRLGRPTDARDGWLVTALTPSHRAVAYMCLAQESARRQQWKDVLHYADKSLSAGGNNPDAQQLLLLAYRKMGQAEKAGSITLQMENDMPLNHFPRFERYMNTRSENNKNLFLQYIRNELPHETFMEMAGWYENVGCNEEALILYAFAHDYPIAAYHAACIMAQANDDSWRAMLQRAESLSTHLVFPFRTETLPVLEWAVQQSDKWVNKYYLGILSAFLGDESKAARLLEQCGDLPDDASFYLARAQFRRGAKKLEDLLRAEQFGNSWRAGMALIQYYQQTEQYDKMYDAAKKYTALYPGNYVLGLKYAAALLYRGEYSNCTDYLATLQVLPNEGAHEGRKIYRDAWLFRALQTISAGDYTAALSKIDSSKIWLENLGVGKPYDEDIDLRSEDFLTAYCYEKMNDRTKAADYYGRVTSRTGYSANELLSVYVLWRENNRRAAGQRMTTFVERAYDKDIARWCQSVYLNNFTGTPEHLVISKPEPLTSWERKKTDLYYDIVKEIVNVCR